MSMQSTHSSESGLFLHTKLQAIDGNPGERGGGNIAKFAGIFAEIKISLSLTEHLVQLVVGVNGLSSFNGLN